MRMITLEEYIQAPPERVFEVFSDIPGTGARLSGISRIEMLSEGPIGKGTRWRETRTMFGKEAVEEMGITEFDPPRGYSVAAENHGAKYLTFYTLIPEGEGTRVVMEFGCEPQTKMAKLMMKLFFKPMAGGLRKALMKDMVELKQACEQPA